MNWFVQFTSPVFIFFKKPIMFYRLRNILSIDTANDYSTLANKDYG